MKAILSSANALRKLMSAAVILLFGVMMTATLVQVLGRYVFDYSIAIASEIATYSQIWLVMLGSGIAMARNQHVAIALFQGRLPQPMARAASVAIALIIAVFLVVISYGAIPLIKLGTFQTSPAMQMPMWIMYLCIPAGAFYIALELLFSVIARWDDPFGASEAEIAEEGVS